MRPELPDEPMEWTFFVVGLLLMVRTKMGRIERIRLDSSSDSDSSGEDPIRNNELGNFVAGRLFGTVPMAWSLLSTDQLTDFQRAVYEETVSTAPEERRSYKDLAIALDKPGASRAIGQALGNNPFPVVIPCHRVIRSDGRLGGFGGTDNNNLKKKLQHRETIFS